VIDGFVNGSSWVTRFGSSMSGLADRTVVDGLVNAIGSRLHNASHWTRRVQTGLIQNYALLMLFGVFAFVSLYLAVR
jgi:NADH-quinone oxidoreductase subunit L